MSAGFCAVTEPTIFNVAPSSSDTKSVGLSTDQLKDLFPIAKRRNAVAALQRHALEKKLTVLRDLPVHVRRAGY